ncbi:D-alanyl-lipoteichoic acid acyltransferase DltB (MBOAT superfamily) [Ulvibacter sp. MAR_2010_11]|uniref:MBOAT family O-acyltransferase n=1 Tax=Ulvibacter sp. MAR_2010_11 TaxID=1250229 RepID=UPI000C2CAA50|nr:MBOAT family O-acyltransferase [Ulvibacter sp. MAR_2010_11]PKA84329.1 D-alanyl-lipoteichoic acid acyltransferase DltB (MBOAT superfamily) [Ulvibacter sp. MAR_2010_11]
MLFNSFDFGFFLVIVYVLYWSIGTNRRVSQNILLLAASYVFYGFWDWRFLALLVVSSLIDYLAGRFLEKTTAKSTRKIILWSSILWNLGVLVTFKYFGFFISGFTELFSITLPESSYSFWNIAIPLGLSFYTFQTMSYTIDVYRNKIKPTHNLIEFLCFVSFFPQLVAGPIERAKKLLPQFEMTRSFNVQSSKEGLRQILWGLFKKILVADKLGLAVSMVYANPEGYGSLMLIFASVLFCFQVYCDFSGYTDIALGTAKLFGFRLSKNFDQPYLSKSITELWQRWHITLTRWFTDYVYVPFVKNTKHPTALIRALGLLITMFLVGLWHGANWTFVAFGVFNGLILVAERIPFFKKQGTLFNKLQSAPRIIPLMYVFVIFTISAVFFRSESIDEAWLILSRIFTLSPDTVISSLIGIKLLYLVVLLIAEMATRNWEFPLQKIEIKLPKLARWAVYYILIILIIRYAEPKEAFIYFQF